MSYFNNKYKPIIEKPKDIKPLLKENMILIAGDFYGIQKFIFEGLSTKNASKVLRAKSAFIQIFTEYLAKYICKKLGIDEKHILSCNAGKFEILSSELEINMGEMQQKIDTWFLKNFYGLSGVSLCSVHCEKRDFTDVGRYKKLRLHITNELEKSKFQKFDLQHSQSVLSYDTDIDNETLCRVCNIRKIEKENCRICNSFIELGKKLSFEHIDELVSSDALGIDFDDDFVIDIALTEKIKSYILFDGDEPVDFGTLANDSCRDMETGIKALGVLKADVDSMGKFLEMEKNNITGSFENFDMFSKTMDNFFSLYVPKELMRKKYKNTYTVFAGGDDLFLVGAWDEIVDLAREIHDEFEAFIQSELSISFGISIAKPSTPISYLANNTEELLERSKEIDDEKDAITLFGETVKWERYNEVYKKLFVALEDVNPNTAFTYRLLELIEMSKRVKYNGDIQATMWKSKLSYSFNRNMGDKDKAFLVLLNGMIEKYPKESKMVVNEFIYKRRD